MAVLPNLKELGERLGTQVNTIKNLKGQSSWVNEMQNLKRDLIGNEEMVQKMIKTIEESPEPSWDYVRSLEERIQFLERRVAQLKHLEYSLQTGQIAFDFEKDLATYIYPNGKKFGSRKIFMTMKKWLEMKNETQQGSEANKKWNDLQKEFSWSDDHEKVFFKLLEFTREFAHPRVDLKAIKTQIPDDFTNEEKILIQDIITMTERVNKLMDED